MKYELINPSDKVIYDAPNKLISGMATLSLSAGYGGDCLDNPEQSSPIFLFGGGSEWLEEQSGLELEACFKTHAAELVKTLRSFELVGERTSLNDIVTVANKVANNIETRFLKKVAAK